MNFNYGTGVGRSATSIELKRAQRHRSLELHPDKNPNNPNAESDMAKLNKIYEVLSNQVHAFFCSWCFRCVQIITFGGDR